MNLLGKTLTVLIVVASVALMVFSMAVYSTHRNWKTTAEKLEKDLSAARNQNQQLESTRRKLEGRLTAEVEESVQQVRKLETERDQLIGQNSTIQSQLDQLLQQQRTSIAAVASTQSNNEKLAAEVKSLRQEIRDNQQARDDAFAIAVRATDDLHQVQGSLTAIHERNVQLVQEVGTKTSLLREKGIDPNTEPGAIVPAVRGVVSAMQRQASGQLIEVTVGADDGLKPGHTIEVFRGERYLGRAEILRTEPDRAVGRVIRRFQQGQIQEGDHVATRLGVG